MTTLGKRLAVSAVLVSLTIYTIFFAPHWFFFLIIETFGLLGLSEFFAMAEKKDVEINRVLGLFCGGLIPISVYFAWEPVIIVAACLCLFIFNFSRRKVENPLITTSVTVFGIIYVTWFFSHLLKLREMPHGAALVFYSILLVKGGDAGAYFVGRKFGRVKLIEHISPNKSVEGAWGCLATTVLLSLLSKIYLPHLPLFHLFILGLILGVVSQLGDLGESLLKRDAGVKDSGTIPGLGGILDVLDSLLLTVPVIYYYIAGFVEHGLAHAIS